jgi:tetratricopeptide (TPR) repeat protein
MNKIIKFSLLFFVFNIMVNGQSQDYQNYFKAANNAYHQQNYEQAIELYQNILSQGYHSKEIYFNIGNSYYRLNRIGEAILYYEKAQKLDPRDVDIQYNLELANLRVIDRIEWDNLKLFFSIQQLSRLISVLFALTVFCLILWLFTKRYRLRRWILYLSAVAGLLTIFWAYILIIRTGELKEFHWAIVLTPTVTVLSAPDENSTDVFLLHEGVKVSLNENRGDWVKISLPDGKSGWMKKNDIGII